MSLPHARHSSSKPLQRSALFEAIKTHAPSSTAVVHSRSGRSFTYGSLLADVSAGRDALLAQTGTQAEGIVGQRVAFLVENGYDYVVTLLSILAANAIAVPLSPAFPPHELRYILNQSEALALLASGKFEALAGEVLREGVEAETQSGAVEKRLSGAEGGGGAPELADHGGLEKGGMMLYTSGTTARPKGVFLPHNTLVAQAESLHQAWDYSSKDRLLHILPLHHIHGTVNALLTPLLAGSAIEFMFPFNVDHVWHRLAAPFLPKDQQRTEEEQHPITFLTAVPTVWARLLQSHSQFAPELQAAANEAIQRKNLRLNISGSAALPTPTKQAWADLSNGNVLLERFGMTEVGMALSCGLSDIDRLDGSVGWPLPGVEARLVDPDTDTLVAQNEDLSTEGRERSGEVQLRGPTIFKAYWRNPAATAKEFTPDGWFKTGDIAVRRAAPSGSGAGQGASGAWARGNPYFILGRRSADIIKTGGEKVSALEIEREILSIPQIRECAIVGLPSETWGQKVAAVIVLTEEGKTAGKGGKPFGAMDLRRALKGRLVSYKIPQDVEVVGEIPRNAMGKINKKTLVESVFGDGGRIRRRSVAVAEERREAKRKEV